MDLELAGKRAIVTGASRGIGRAIAARLAAEGARVAICARGQTGVDEAVAALGDGAWGQALDVRAEGAIEGYVTAAAAALGGVDLVVSNVSTRLKPGVPGWWAESFETDLHQHVRLFDAALPHLKSGVSPAVVMVASIAAVMTSLPREEIAYGAMKAALLSFTGQMAAVHGPPGVRVNAVAPGPILFEGGTWDAIRTHRPGLFEAAARLPSLGRHGRPEEVADAVAFLLSPRAGYITGTALRIDGGAVKTVNF